MKPRSIMRLLMCAILLCVLCGVASGQDWRRYGHDGALTGRCAIAGDIRSPHVRWSFSVAGAEQLILFSPDAGEHELTLAPQSQPSSVAELPSLAGPMRLDVTGDGTLHAVTESYHERWAQILPDTPGYQRVAWSHTWTDQAVCRLELFAYDQGLDQPRRVWQSDPPEGTIFNPLNIVFDIDGDGVQEICVAAHYRVMIFEGTTGRKESELRYHGSRPYGWFGLADVDGDAQVELVTIGDFQSHLDVLEYDAKQPDSERLSVRWRRDIEQDIDKRSKWPQVGPQPLVEVTGDGRPEIIVNLFNDQGDGQWHVAVLDANTGATIADLPQRFYLGTIGGNDSSSARVCVTTTRGVLVHQAGQIELIRLGDKGPEVCWQRQGSAWCTSDAPRLGHDWSTTASQGMRRVHLQGDPRPMFAIKTWDPARPSAVELSTWQCDAAGGVERLWSVTGLPESARCEVVEDGALQASEVLLRVPLAAHTRCELKGFHARAELLQSRPLGTGVSMPIVAATHAAGGMSVIVEGPGDQIVCLAPPTKEQTTPDLRWQRPGRGMRDGSLAIGLLATDLDQDGTCEVVAATRAAVGHALLTAYRGNGEQMWQKPFPEILGDVPVWNSGALTFWWDGDFRGTEKTDLFVNVRRSLMHSDVGYLVDGRTGETVWTQEKAQSPGQFQWGYAGTPLATVDVDADSSDELICLHPVCYWLASGHDGALRVGKELASRAVLPAWAAYGQPLVHDFDGDGQPEVLLDSPYILALLEMDGAPVWHGPPRMDYPVNTTEGNASETTQCKHALVDIDGDGWMEIASAGYGDGVRVIDPRTGRKLWSCAAPAPTVPKVSAANIDGVGGDEIIYSAGDQLIAVTGDVQAGRLLWSWQASGSLSMPAIADVDDDGKAEIIIQDSLGAIHCIDGVEE